MHARLVQNDVRELRQPVFDVLHPAAADDIGGLPIVRLPERRLVDPAGLFLYALTKAESVKHFHRAAGDAVGLPKQQPARFLLDNAGLDVGKLGQLRGKRQSRRSAADNQDVNLRWHRPLRSRGGISVRSVKDLRVAWLEAIQMKLHAP